MKLHRQLAYVVMIFLSTFVAGAAGYRMVEGWPFFDCIYMSVITVTTVGFSEVQPLSPSGKLFTTVLILIGVGSITYSFGVITNYVVAGELQGFLGERKMRRLISSLRNHYIVCGYGRMGHELCQELLRENLQFMVVDAQEESVKQAREDGYVAFHGDPGLDETLRQCHIDRASGLAVVSDDDAKNLMIVISARGLNTGLSIVARISAEDAPEKFTRAGANSVFLPYRTGGRRIAQMLLRPEVIGFLEDVLHDQTSVGLVLEAFVVQENSKIEGKTIAEARIRQEAGVYVVGLRRPDRGIEPDLDPTTVLQTGDTVIALGKRQQLDALNSLLKRVE